MDFKEACHHLRISPQLLRWFRSYSAKGDGHKLQQSPLGDFEEAELDAFSAHLRTAWLSRSVPNGIERELRVEACGLCGLCQQPCEKPQTAHICRKGRETTFYTQHPENLILLCGTCHDRYDDHALKSVSLDVILAAKQRLVSRKMEAIDRDVQIARAVRATVDTAKTEIRTQLAGLTSSPLTNALLWQSGAALLLNATTRGIFGGSFSGAPSLDLSSPTKALEILSGSLQPTQQVTHALLDGYALEADGSADEAPAEWDLISDEQPDSECTLCGCLKDTVDYYCEDCDHSGSNLDPPDYVEQNSLGVFVPVYSDARGDTHKLACERCDSENLELSYPESVCSRCSHKISKND